MLTWELDDQNKGRTFFQDFLRCDFGGIAQEDYEVSGSGGIFSGLEMFSFAVSSGAPYHAESPDRLVPRSDARANLAYSRGGSAGIEVETQNYRVVLLGFPFECIASAEIRNQVMAAVLDYFPFRTGLEDVWTDYR